MISVVSLWKQIQTTAKSGTSGYQSQDEFNSDLATVQLRIANVLCDNYHISEKIEDALFGLIKSNTADTDTNGVFVMPTDYFRLIDLWYNLNGVPTPANKISSNQISSYTTSYIRKPDLTKDSLGYYFMDSTLQVLPKTQVNATLVYCQKPPAASITLTAASDSNSDYLTPTAGADLIWSPVVYNLFVYMMLEMLGIEMRDNILYEYATLGIPKEAYIGMSINTNQNAQ